MIYVLAEVCIMLGLGFAISRSSTLMNNRIIAFLFSFKGRIGRLPWWCIQLVLLPVVVFGEWFNNIAAPPHVCTVIRAVLLFIVIPTFWVLLTTGAKRYHDIGKSGWWLLQNWIPFVGSLWVLYELGFIVGDPNPNRFGLPNTFGNDLTVEV